MKIEIIDEQDNLVDYRVFRTSWQNNKGKSRFRVIPLKVDEDGKRTEAKLHIPVIYLGLSRLFPIREANGDNITTNKIEFFDKEKKKWFIENYTEILSIHECIENVSNYSIGETDKKRV